MKILLSKVYQGAAVGSVVEVPYTRGEWLARNGFGGQVADDYEPQVQPDTSDAQDREPDEYDAMGVEELKALAEERDVLLSDEVVADALRSALRAAAPAAEDAKEPEQPNISDNKPKWIEYAIAKGEDPAAAEAMTKDALIEKYASAS